MTDSIGSYAKGVLGENAAAQYLHQLGYEWVERRFRSPYGEVDLIMLDHQILVMIEVKTREHDSRCNASLAVTPAKQKRLLQSASHYLSLHPEHADRPIRFDVVAIGNDGILHIPNAFEASRW